ncbi:hypothetical protein GOBAR_DD21447 [Gossypium barbadense]|nr:hypothetical protein GOBAR_DD21447 [Gossypium barbadense]
MTQTGRLEAATAPDPIGKFQICLVSVVTPGNTTWRMFTYKELHTATNGFCDDNKLGEGGFGSVYWGKTGDGLQVIYGCEVQLDWKKRMKIAIGSAEGISYLHHEVTPHIIHRDIKASNVLLDSDFEPLVADFGFAKLIPEGVSHMTTRVKGTLGYLAPEYAMWGKVSDGCDVYSFGILLLELLTGRKPIEKLPGGVKRSITEWAEPLVARGQFKDLVDPKLRGNFDENQLKQAISVACLCVQSEPEKRPNMKEVVYMLKGYGSEGKVLQARMDSVKYKEELLALDQTSDEDDGGPEESYGVFGPMEVQEMQDPYNQHGDTAKHV